MRRTYDQYCGVARALEILGERWTLLVVRELLLGPRRFSDLLEGLPGIGTNMLSARLKTLESAGVVRRSKLPPPAGANVYELTELGRELEEPLVALGRWGFSLIGAPRGEDHYSFRWLLLGMKALFRADDAEGVNDTYEFRIDDEVFWAEVRDGEVEIGSGPARDPDATITTDIDTFLAIGMARLDPAAAAESGVLAVEGDAEAALRAGRLFTIGGDEAGGGAGSAVAQRNGASR